MIMHAALRVIGQDEGEGTKARVGPENAVPWPLYCCAMRDSVPLDGDRVRRVTREDKELIGSKLVKYQ